MPEQLFVCGDARLSRRDGTILVAGGGRKTSFPIETVRHVVWVGDGIVSSKLLQLLGRSGVRLSVFDHEGWFKGAFEPAERPNSGEIRLRQAALVLDGRRRLSMARRIVAAALHNIRAVLAYHAYRGNRRLDTAMAELARRIAEAGTAPDIPSLMGMEGNARKSYYAAWTDIDPRLDFGPRVRRPPNNPVNCLISFLNGLTYAAMRHEIAKTHLDDGFAFLHAASSSRSSLALDLTEPFKPVLCDRLIHRMIRKGELRDGWFDRKPGVCLLTEAGRRDIVARFTERLERDGNAGIRKRMHEEALAVERHLLGIAEYEPYREKL